MLVRILQFLIGAVFMAAGGYLGWMNRNELGVLFPPGPGGPPWLLVLSVLALAAGLVFLVSAVHPRPNRRREREAREAARSARLGEAEAYYAEAGRAADRDWRSGEIPEPVVPQSPPAVAQATPDPAPPAAPQPAKPVATAVPPPEPPPAAEPAPVAPPVAAAAFPSTASLSPIPVAAEAPPAAPAADPVAAIPATPDANAPIREAIKAGRLDEAERLLEAGRETAQGLALAELTGLAGDHAAASGRQSHAKWLWRLAIKRFGEAGAMDAPAARAVAESLRVSG